MIVAICTFIYVLSRIAKAEIGTTIFEKVMIRLYSWLILLLYGLIFFKGGQLLADEGKVSFWYILIAILTYVVPLTFFIKSIVDTAENILVVFVISIFGFLFSEAYILILFGLYNLTSANLFAIVNQKSWQEFFSICIYYGGKNIFSFPTLTVNKDTLLLKEGIIPII
ncbi:hypothetical protein P4S95_18075 [Aneurinibacillus aneurinilyticus]|uniref:hypothetical protein n=1 Tax=Aneurinibacillus aneurinilyticus TaxID=1391 RepID=UPI002E222184|nr:hypothetical protein [Aneurinibacillus aneurinilyticus]